MKRGKVKTVEKKMLKAKQIYWQFIIICVRFQEIQQNMVKREKNYRKLMALPP